jgi:hypothetical protein
MSDQHKIALNLERWKAGVNAHDRENPSHDPAYGIGMSYFDIDRLGLDVGEELWPGVAIYDDGGTTGNFRVLCNGSHASGQGKVEAIEAIAAAGPTPISV